MKLEPNIVESGVKHHQTNKQTKTIIISHILITISRLI